MADENAAASGQGTLDQTKPADSPGSGTATPGTSAAAKGEDAPQAPTDDALRDAFTLGWSIRELGSRIEVARDKGGESGLRLASVWRAAFGHIAALQLKTFPKNSTLKTLYEPPTDTELPYLYPPADDYSDVMPPQGKGKGISNYPDEGILAVTDAAGNPLLADFKLYDVTRRAINCLTLLYVKDEECLRPRTIAKNREYLVNAILAATQQPEGGDPNPPADTAQAQDSLQRAKNALTYITVKFLDAWDGYLRENYYAGGTVPNNDLELIAYDAGRSMSSLSWGIAVRTAPLEYKPADPAQKQDDAAQQGAAPTLPEQPLADPLSAELVKQWRTVFRDQDVIRIQHQITALSTALDDNYYDRTKQKRPADSAVLVAPNPDLPSQAIQAVKRSLDYWQNTVKWISKPENLGRLRNSTAPDAAHWGKSMRLALNEQANVWQTLMTGQQSLRAYSMESVTQKIMEDVTAEIQRGLRSGLVAGVRQAEALALDLASEAKEAINNARSIAVTGLNELLGLTRQRVYWVVGGMFVLVLLLLVLAFYFFGTAASANNGNAAANLTGGGALGAGLSGILSAILGSLGLSKLQGAIAQKQQDIEREHNNAETNVDKTAAATATAGTGGNKLLARVEGAAGQAGAMIVDAVTKGYEQARIELDGLSRSVAVSYPLVEFFGASFQLEADVSFLTGVIWSRAERDAELARVTRAAFGPLAAFITTSDDGSGSGSALPAAPGGGQRLLDA